MLPQRKAQSFFFTGAEPTAGGGACRFDDELADDDNGTTAVPLGEDRGTTKMGSPACHPISESLNTPSRIKQIQTIPSEPAQARTRKTFEVGKRSDTSNQATGQKQGHQTGDRRRERPPCFCMSRSIFRQVAWSLWLNCWLAWHLRHDCPATPATLRACRSHVPCLGPCSLKQKWLRSYESSLG